VVDTSGAQPIDGVVEYAVELLGPERVEFGSDWPLRDFAVQRARVEGAAIDEAAKRLVLGGNIARILAGAGVVS
jgi:hypothetical protein